MKRTKKRKIGKRLQCRYAPRNQMEVVEGRAFKLYRYQYSFIRPLTLALSRRERGIVFTLILKRGREDFIQTCRRQVAERARSAIVRLKGCKKFCHPEFSWLLLPKSLISCKMSGFPQDLNKDSALGDRVTRLVPRLFPLSNKFRMTWRTEFFTILSIRSCGAKRRSKHYVFLFLWFVSFSFNSW